jgi:hypothetical protein
MASSCTTPSNCNDHDNQWAKLVSEVTAHDCEPEWLEKDSAAEDAEHLNYTIIEQDHTSQRLYAKAAESETLSATLAVIASTRRELLEFKHRAAAALEAAKSTAEADAKSKAAEYEALSETLVSTVQELLESKHAAAAAHYAANATAEADAQIMQELVQRCITDSQQRFLELSVTKNRVEELEGVVNIEKRLRTTVELDLSRTKAVGKSQRLKEKTEKDQLTAEAEAMRTELSLLQRRLTVTEGRLEETDRLHNDCKWQRDYYWDQRNVLKRKLEERDSERIVRSRTNEHRPQRNHRCECGKHLSGTMQLCGGGICLIKDPALIVEEGQFRARRQ